MASKRPQIFAAAAATIGAFGLGTVLAWPSPALPALFPHEKNDTTGIEFDDQDCPSPLGCVSLSTESWIGSIITLGAMVSGPITGICIDAFGRKTTMLLLSAPFVLGWLLIAYAQNVAMMLIGRFITGFCGGSFSLAAPVYIGEMAEDSIRGALGSGFQFMVVLGILFVYCVGAIASWQWLPLICGFVPLVFLVAMIFVPESPRYLVMKGMNAEASKALCWFRSRSSSQDVEDELRIIEMSVNEMRAQKTTLTDLVKYPYYLKPTLIMLGLMLFQQLSGINAVIFYTSKIFDDAGSTLNNNVSAIIVGIVQVAATGLAVVLVDRLGRRILLLVSGAVMGISLVLLGVYFLLDHNSDPVTEDIGWLPLVSLIVFIVAFSIGFGPIPWMLLGEMLPANVKGNAAALSTAFNWFLAFLVTKFFEDVKDAINAHWCYWMFAIVCGVGVVFLVLIVPETKGKSAEEIQVHFGAPVYNNDRAAPDTPEKA